MEAERVYFRKPTQTATIAPSPNTAFKRKPVVPRQVEVPLAKPQIGRNDGACPHCGADDSSEQVAKEGILAEESQRRIAELETEVKHLTEKAIAAADKLADYEDELRKLKAAQARPPDPRLTVIDDKSSLPAPAAADANGQAEEEDTVPSLPSAPAPQQLRQARPGGLGRALTTTRITNFLAARRASPASQTASPISPGYENTSTPTSEADWNARLGEAENARKAAEKKLKETNQELEELSASLFQSANEMVASERRQNAEREAAAEQKAKEREDQWQEWQKQVKKNEQAATARTKKLEDKVKKLEQRVQILEDREKAKAERLERLEMAMKRTAKIRGMLHPMSAPG